MIMVQFGIQALIYLNIVRPYPVTTVRKATTYVALITTLWFRIEYSFAFNFAVSRQAKRTRTGAELMT